MYQYHVHPTEKFHFAVLILCVLSLPTSQGSFIIINTVLSIIIIKYIVELAKNMSQGCFVFYTLTIPYYYTGIGNLCHTSF